MGSDILPLFRGLAAKSFVYRISLARKLPENVADPICL